MIRRSNYRTSRSGGGLRLLIALAFAVFAIISYLGSSEFNPVTGENQYVSLTKQQEIQLGLQSVPEMLQQFGPPYSDEEVQEYLDDVGFLLVNNSVAADSGWQWEFTLINNPELINAFALPGGQIFITTALFSEFENEAQLAGVLAHEIVHVLARHSSQQIAKQELTQGLIGAVAIGSEDANTTQVALVVGQLVNMNYSREAETQSDLIGVEIMSDAGYDPREMVNVMQILAQAGGSGGPEFFSTHPNPENRIGQIEAKIAQLYPGGVPDNLDVCIIRCE